MEWVGRKIEVLDTEEGNQLTDGIIQDEDADERGSELNKETARRWTRIARAAVNLAGLVDSFTWMEGTREWKVDGRDEDRHEREQEEIRREGQRWTNDALEIDADGVEAEADESLESEDDEEDSEERPKWHPRRTTRSTPILNVVPGYSVLLLTNIILSSLFIVALIIESLRWTAIIPVPTGPDTTQLGEAAQEAVAYITSHIRPHATATISRPSVS
ncbi:hypothetical protein EV363DRAFT_1397750 [Boletus edulis]|nr:hypothetical protein EV363DRAFT_1397750 [Boletus edulis]